MYLIGFLSLRIYIYIYNNGNSGGNYVGVRRARSALIIKITTRRRSALNEKTADLFSPRVRCKSGANDGGSGPKSTRPPHNGTQIEKTFASTVSYIICIRTYTYRWVILSFMYIYIQDLVGMYERRW